MKKISTAIGLLPVLFYGIISCQNSGTASSPKPNQPESVQLVKRGEYLVNTIGCDDCHSPKKMGAMGPEVIAELRFSGYPSNRPLPQGDTGITHKGMAILNQDLTCAIGPWGTTFSANITSDSTGIGNWTEAQFIKAIREGKSKGLDGNRPLLPPMPWQNFAKMTDEDLKAIFAYLTTTKPVRNVVPQPVLAALPGKP